MSLFKKRKTGNIAGNAALSKIRNLIAKRHRQAADYLGRKTQYWNRNSKIIALVIFCLIFGGSFLLLLIKAIIHL